MAAIYVRSALANINEMEELINLNFEDDRTDSEN